MMKTSLLATLAFLIAGPAFAAGWVDGEIRNAAEGPEWSTATPVAKMPKPDTSNPMPMGVQEAPTGFSASSLAAEVAGWEAAKERHWPSVELNDRNWKLRPTHERYVEIGHPVEKDLPKHLVHDLHKGEYHARPHSGHADHYSRQAPVLRVHADAYEEDGGDVGYGPAHGDHHHHGHRHPPMPDHSHEGHAAKAGETPHHVLEIDVDLRDNCGSTCWYEITRP